MRVLVVEDDDFSRKLIVSLLEKNSIEVKEMGSAKAALDFLENGEFVDVIVSDVMMPHMDGFTFVHQLHTDGRLNKIPVILCTALGDTASIVKGAELGIAGYIVKPIKEAILISKVNKVVEDSPGAILVVDDEELIRDLLITMLEREGYKTLSSESGTKAVEILKENRISMVLSDIAMPEMDGFELLSHVKEYDMAVPVILMSGRSEYDREEIVANGADDFIPKPFHNTEILARVRAKHQKRGKK